MLVPCMQRRTPHGWRVSRCCAACAWPTWGPSASEESVESLAALRGYFYQRFRTQGAALMWLCGEQALQLAA